MRRAGWLVLVAGSALAGCGSFKDVFTSHAETAARVDTKELKSARVAEIISRLGGPGANPEAAELVTGIWVDLSLFGDQVASGQLKTDSASLDRLLWPQLAEAKVSTWHDTVVAHRPPVGDAEVDAAYNGEQVRLFQHILVMAAGPTPADTAKAKATAERVLPQAKSGNFGKLAAQYSSDGSKNDGGFLPLGPKGQFVKEFDDAAWQLGPGQVSGIVKSQFGFHIIRRPTLAESRDRYLTKVKETATLREDSAFMAKVVSSENLTVASGAPAALKSGVADLAAARKSTKTMVNLKNGTLTLADLIRWIEVLPTQAFAQIRAADDSLLIPFIKNVAQNALLLRQADSAKIQINPTMYQGYALQLKAQIGSLKDAIGLNVPELADSSKTPAAERKRLASTKVEEYFDKLVSGQAQFKQIPPTLSVDMRAEGDFKIYPAGVNRAKELVIAKKKADSAAGRTGGAPGAPQPGQLQPAPGGPPTPQGADTSKKP